MARAQHAESGHGQKGFAKRMSDHVALGLVAYTLMLIFAVTPAVETKGTSIFPYLILVVLVAVIIPVFRKFESRWQMLEGSELSESGLKTRFTMDRITLWLIAFGVPLGLMVICRTLSSIF